MTDIMLDIETLGLKPGAIVVSIGACVFDRTTGEIGGEFYRVIDVADSAAHGLTIEAGTAMWWIKQSDEARAVFFDIVEPLADVAQAFSDWVGAVRRNLPEPWNGGSGDSPTFWAQGDMDFNVWGAAMDAVGMSRPWAFWAQRDTRTAYDICNFDPKAVERDGTYHNALHDARHQVKCLHLAMRDVIGEIE